MKISALLVCHDGAKWLPAAIDALEASTRLPDSIAVVDNGSTDRSAELVNEAFGTDPVRLPRTTGYGAAVEAALATLPPAEPDEWLWLLHDDCRPEPDCLEALIRSAERSAPDVVALGPKLRVWSSPPRLAEVGVTISGSGRRETGLEPLEFDHGQHDEPRRVLAVNTAGMLIRRETFESFGLDPELPLFGNDIDLGWRLASAGLSVQVVPAAVMAHAEGAQERGQHAGRRGELAGKQFRDQRSAAMYTLLANSSPAMAVMRWFRLLGTGVLRALGQLLVRRPGRAAEELAAIGRVHLRPRRILSARRRRRDHLRRLDTSGSARPLLAPWWMPLRHASDFAADLGRAGQEAVREAVHVRTGVGPESTVRGQVLRSPTVWVMVGVLLLSVLAGRELLAGAPLHGGALLPAPDGVGEWWSTWAHSWHWVGLGSSAPAPAYLLVFSVLGTLLFGQPELVVWLLFVLTAPLAFWGASRVLRRLVRGRLAAYWGAAAYALVPIVTGSVAQGRLGTVAAAVLFPWTAGAALRLAARNPDHRARAVWRTALGVSLLVLMVPLVWVVALVLVLASGWWFGPRVSPARLWPIVVAPPVVAMPWLLGVLDTPAALLFEAGSAAALPVDPGSLDLLAGRLGGPGAAPAWFGLGIAVAAVIALARASSRSRVIRAWVVAAASGLVLLGLSRIQVTLPGVVGELRPSYSFFVLLLQAALVVAVVMAADGALSEVTGGSFTWRQPLAGLGVIAAVGAVVLGAAWWVSGGTPGPLHRSEPAVTPVYMADLANSRPDGATLLVRGGPTEEGAAPVSFEVLRADSQRLGDAAIAELTPPDETFTAMVQRVLASDGDAAEQLASYGIAYVYAPAPVSDEVAGAFDATDGFSQASASDGQSRAWRVDNTPDLAAITVDSSPLRPLLLVLQVLALLALLVLAAPSRPAPRGDR